MTRIDIRDVYRRLNLANGRYVDIVDWFPKYTIVDENRNLFLRDAEGEVIWQVQSKFDVKRFQINEAGKRVEIPPAGPYTGGLKFDGGRLRAYRWDGFMYDIDIESGVATPAEFVK